MSYPIVSCRSFATTTTTRHYANSWRKPQLRNPNLARAMPTKAIVGNESRKSNMIYVCGLGTTGSLGMPKFYKPNYNTFEEYKAGDTSSKTFRRLGVFSVSDRIHDVACGYGFTIVAAEVPDSSHTVMGFGMNSHSQLGFQEARQGFPLEIVASPSPIVLPTKTPIIRVACGRSHSIFMNRDREVFSLGDNSFGQCGRPINEHETYFADRKTYKIKQLPPNISQIECGQDHSFFIAEDGKVFACGWGSDGQTGLGHYDNQSEPMQAKGDLDGAKIIKVSSSADTVLALDDKGNVFGWGNTEYAQFRVLGNCESEQFNVPRQLKLGSIPGKIVDIAAGGTMCALLNDRGQMYVWGFGILGKGPNVDQSSRPTLIPESLFGQNVYNPEVKVVKIYAGLSYFAAINSLGDLYTWGKNRGQQLGHFHGSDQYFPMRVDIMLSSVKKAAIGVDHCCLLVETIV